MGAYSIYIGTHALDYDMELLNPKKRANGARPEETCISAKYTAEMNSAGSCTFKIPPTHPYYNDIQPLITEVVVVEIDNVVWFGRVASVKKDWNNCKTVTCEGALAYLNDSIQPYHRYFQFTSADYFRAIIRVHNTQVPSNRQLGLADILPPDDADNSLNIESNYETTMSAVQRLIDDQGGYIYCLMDEFGNPELYWITDRNVTSGQPVVYGKNLLDLASDEDRTNIFTKLLPLGADVEVERLSVEEDGTPIYEYDDDGEITETQAKEQVEMPLRLDFTKMTGLEPDEDGVVPVRYTAPDTVSASAYISGSNVNTYGSIVRTVTFNEANTIEKLRSEATAWFNKQELGGLTLTVDAADLRFLDSEEGRFYLGLSVQVTSEPHGLSETLTITRIEADIKTASKRITLGHLPKKTLSDMVGRNASSYSVGKRPIEYKQNKRTIKKVNNKKELPANHADTDILYFIPK